MGFESLWVKAKAEVYQDTLLTTLLRHLYIFLFMGHMPFSGLCPEFCQGIDVWPCPCEEGEGSRQSGLRGLLLSALTLVMLSANGSIPSLCFSSPAPGLDPVTI